MCNKHLFTIILVTVLYELQLSTQDFLRKLPYIENVSFDIT